MATFKDDSVAINLNILKQCGFYQIFDPNNKKIFGWNVYLLSFIALNVIFQCIFGFGNCGLLFEKDDMINISDLFLITFINSFDFIYLWKIAILMLNRKKILDLLDVTNLQFLKSKQCRNNIEILYKHRIRVLKITKLYLYLIIVVLVQWVSSSILINSFIVSKNENQRLESVLSRRYPLNVNTYNQYYVLFYALETIIGIQTIYALLMIDILLFSTGWAIIIQYEILSVAFKNIGQYVNLHKGKTTFLTNIRMCVMRNCGVINRKVRG